MGRGRRRIVVRLSVSRAPHVERGNLRYARIHRGAPDAAVQRYGSRDEHDQWKANGSAYQRSGTICGESGDRFIALCGSGYRDGGPGNGSCATRGDFWSESLSRLFWSAGRSVSGAGERREVEGATRIAISASEHRAIRIGEWHVLSRAYRAAAERRGSARAPRTADPPR